MLAVDLRRKEKRTKVIKNILGHHSILILHSRIFYLELCKNALLPIGVTLYPIHKMDEIVDHISFIDTIIKMVKLYKPGLIIVDLNYHLSISEAIKEIKEIQSSIKFIYICALGKKYFKKAKKAKNLPEPCLREEQIKNRPKILLNLAKKVLSEP